MHVPRELLDALERRTRQHAVAEIEDVPGPAARASQHVVGAGEQAIDGAEQQRRIEIALDAAVGADESQASSSGSRQSMPITSPPASARSRRIAVVPTPK